MKTTRVTIYDKNLNTIQRREKAQRVAGHMYQIINSELFKKLVLEMPDSWRIGESSRYKHYPIEEIYKMIRYGNEEFSQEGNDYELDLYVDDYYRGWSKVVGYIIPFKKTIWVNTKFFDTMSDEKVGSNFTHEISHHLGFRHSGPNLRQSIPYYLNEVYSKCYKQLIEGKEPDKPRGYWSCKRNWRTLWFTKLCKWVAV